MVPRHKCIDNYLIVVTLRETPESFFDPLVIVPVRLRQPDVEVHPGQASGSLVEPEEGRVGQKVVHREGGVCAIVEHVLHLHVGGNVL